MKTENPSAEVSDIISTFLMGYRKAMHCTTNESPAKLMMGHDIRTLLDTVNPLYKPQYLQSDRSDEIHKRVKHVQQNQIRNYKGHREISFTEGENVVIRDYRDPNQEKWMSVKIHKVLGSRTYLAKITSSGRLIKRHTNQIRKACVENGNEVLENENIKRRFEEQKRNYDLTKIVKNKSQYSLAKGKGASGTVCISSSTPVNGTNVTEAIIDEGESEEYNSCFSYDGFEGFDNNIDSDSSLINELPNIVENNSNPKQDEYSDILKDRLRKVVKKPDRLGYKK